MEPTKRSPFVPGIEREQHLSANINANISTVTFPVPANNTGEHIDVNEQQLGQMACVGLEYASESLFFSEGSSGSWPDWAEEDPDWAKLYGGCDAQVSPRMAAVLYNELIIAIDEFRFAYHRRIDRLPFLARAHFRSSTAFARGFVACLERLMLRLRKGILPHPNCMGEYVALVLVLHEVELRGDFEDLDDYCDGKLSKLPVTFRDDDFEALWNLFFPSREDNMIMTALFHDESVDKHGMPVHSNCNSGHLLYAQDKCTLLKEIGCMDSTDPTLNSCSKLWNLHPLRWFFAFSVRAFENHFV